MDEDELPEDEPMDEENQELIDLFLLLVDHPETA